MNIINIKQQASTPVSALLKCSKLFTFKIVKIQSRKSNQYKVVFTEISESSFNCSFIDQYYVPLSRKMVLHTESTSILVESSNPSHFQIIQQIYTVKLKNDVQMNKSLKFSKCGTIMS
ncbi:Hypothetical_protein [Hexamita inflata]|uniref:Hypothetical_protein n=1 Tax=Hexamita inflata TaxID=28002 RepID=A0AA86UA86_9EUKA|nr:Hypothetical protein HINF_LOCUS37230 [Hexamita inflata]